MTWKWSLAFNNNDGKTLYKKKNKQIYLQKKSSYSFLILFRSAL